MPHIVDSQAFPYRYTFVVLRGRFPTWCPEAERAGESSAQYCRLGSSSGPRDEWRALEDRSATRGQTLSAWYCERVLGDPEACDRWFRGIQLECAESPPAAVLPDDHSVQADRDKAGLELDRLAGLGEIRWYSEWSYLPVLRERPSHLTAKAD